ncbi:cilia- and flagella-associated protein 251-like [Brassica napus]|uniref:(rape) hypothetical protein n=1 Tax=Brassica napus TaxID=3708 RepID=A0A816NDF1_BRANA|nr:cilia- and flagella-associated protein 251-like [Brassica napus]CAF2031779.1 unnamed protein product [Brassica napus]
MKKPSSRSQRGSRGIKGKHVLQICVLLGVCIWLVYQVKYSHDKKKEFYETDGKKLLEKEDGLVKLGRKDLLPGYHNQNEKEKHVEEDEDEEEKESKSKVENGTHEEEEEKEEDEVAEEDDEDKSKLGEEVGEEDEDESKHEEDDIDEQDQSKTAGDKDDESLEEEKESDEKEKEKESNNADETDMTVDEAREEHYKADDASSAVSHESRILNTEKLNESSDNSTGTAQENNTNATVSEVEVQKEPVLKLGEAVEDETTTEVKDGDSESSTSEAKSVVTESRGETTVNVNSTKAVLEASGYLQNETKIMQERSQEDGSPPSELQTVIKLEQTRNESDPNVTVSANVTNIDPIQDESRNSTSDSSLIENISGSNTTEVKENTRSEGSDDETVEYKESSNQFSTEQKDEVDDTPESTMLQEEREALTDPQTLPDIRIEGNEEDEEEVISAE